MASRATSRRGKTATKARPTAKALSRMNRPVVPSGARVHLLKVPYNERALASAAGATFYSGYGFAYIGATLPAPLERYEAPAYSWEAFLAAELEGAPPGSAARSFDTGEITLRPDQIEDRDRGIENYEAGAPEFLVGSDTGVGKTITAIAMLKALPVRNIVVVAPISVLPNWRLHLKLMGDGGKRWALINYESAKNLLEKPAARTNSKGQIVKSRQGTINRDHATTGTPRVAWDVVVTDEAHLLANIAAQRSIALDRVIGNPPGARRAAWALRLSATAAANPAQIAYLHRGLAWKAGAEPRRTITPAEFAQWCADYGMEVQADRYGKLAWTENDRDLRKLNHLLFGGASLPLGIRRVPTGWPEQQRYPTPIEFDFEEREAYEVAWHEFQEAMRSIGLGRGPRSGGDIDARRRQQAGLAAQTRYRQKAGLLRAASTADLAANLIESGNQVAISCQYRGTVEAIHERLREHHIHTGLFLGGDPDRENARLAFQRGQTPAIIFTPTEGFSLHANDTTVQGTTTKRALVVAEPRWAPKPGLQIEGRTQRNGEAAEAYYPFAVDTIEHKVITRLVKGMRAVKKINGDDTASIDAVRRAIDDIGDAMGVQLIESSHTEETQAA